MKKTFLYIATIILFSLWLTVLANTIFEIDDAFFSDTGISSWDISHLHFGYNWNNFDGVIFWGTGNGTGELTLWGETITCEEKLRWLYINTARGNKIWPLDEETLLDLSGSSTLSGYDTLSMTGWFFTQCSGTSIDSDGIFGYVEHEHNGETYSLWAWVEYDFGSGTATGNFDNTLLYITGVNNTASGYVFDNYGGIAKVYSASALYGNMTFTGTEAFLSWTDYYSTWTSVQVNIYSNVDADFELSGDIETVITGTLSAGVDQDQTITLDGWNGSKTIQLTVSTGSESDIDTLDIVLNVTDTTPPTVTLESPTNGLTTTDHSINFQWSWSDDIYWWIDYFNLYISGDAQYSRTGITSLSKIVSPLLNGDYTWYVMATDTSGNTGVSSTFTLTISWTVLGPTLTSPSNWASIDLWDLLLSWTGTSASGYTWQIASDSSFANLVATGETDNMSIDPIHNPDFMTWTFYWRVIDDETVWVSDHRVVVIVEPSEWIDLEVDEFEFDDEDDADLSESYQSDEIIIEWITDHVYIPAELEDGIWALFINDIMVGTEWRVKEWDEVYIELISSNDYDERVKTTLIIWEWDNEVEADFRVYTMEEDEEDDDEFELTYTQRLQAIMLLESLVEMYDNNTEKLQQFFSTFQAVLQDRSDMLDSEIDDADSDNELELLRWQKASVDYLYEIIDDYLDDMSHETNTSVYIAPNGKQYLVEYNDDRFAYTSPDFLYQKYFPTWDLFTRHIDLNNPGEYGQWNYHGGDTGFGETVTAPNNKVYHVYQINGKRTSDEFTYKKYFDTREQIVNYIFVNNPGATWNHKIDTSFTPVYYNAPNGKKYTIFKTSSLWANPNKYSSFGFVTPKYFDSLQAAKDHIAMYNK